MNELRIEQVVHRLQKFPEEKVLVLGTKPSNFPERYTRHPRFVFQHNDSDSPLGAKANLGAILSTRFLGHSAVEKVKAAIPDVDFLYPLGTGEIRNILNRVGPWETPETKEVEPVTKKMVAGRETKFAKGELAALLRQCPVPPEEMKRKPGQDRVIEWMQARGHPIPSRQSLLSFGVRAQAAQKNGAPRPVAVARPAAPSTAGLDLLEGIVQGMKKLGDVRDMLQLALEEVDKILGKR